MTRIRIASADLLRVFQERLSSFDDRFKRTPIAIVPSSRGWQAVMRPGYKIGQPPLGRRIPQVQEELRSVYMLLPD